MNFNKSSFKAEGPILSQSSQVAKMKLLQLELECLNLAVNVQEHIILH